MTYNQIADVPEKEVQQEQLVFVKGNEVVTDSLTIAEMFEKEHKNVMRDIARQIEYAGEEFGELNFEPSSYRNKQNKELPKYDLTEEAFTLVVMSYNTKEAVQTKIKFIQEFKRMKEHIQNQQQVRPMDAKESIIENMKLTIMLNEDVTDIKKDVEQIKKDLNERITLDYSQQQSMRNAVNKRVYKLWNEDKVDKSVYESIRKVYSALWKNLKDAYRVNAYPNILQRDFDEAMNFIEGWRPMFNKSA